MPHIANECKVYLTLAAAKLRWQIDLVHRSSWKKNQTLTLAIFQQLLEFSIKFSKLLTLPFIQNTLS